MNAKTTVLRGSRHGEFLQARRQDPVTHKEFAAGDRVTRCSKCLLPFLDLSWDAIGRTHCGQIATVALESSEAPPEESKRENEAAETVSETEVARPGMLPLELMPVPIHLQEVPVTLK
jgi:hypothetical protein